MSSVNLLERNVKKILSSAGFNPRLRADLEGYEIDVYVEYKSERIIFECKQYERSSLTVRNLIHQWSGKQEELGVDKVVLVLVGVSVSEDDYELAERRDMKIWEGETVNNLLDEALEEEEGLKERILRRLGLGDLDFEVLKASRRHNVSRKAASEYLKGKVTREELENISSIENDLEERFDEGVDILREDFFLKVIKNEDYNEKPARKVAKKMSETDIKNADKAFIMTKDRGGKFDGKDYTKKEAIGIEKMIKKLGYDFEKSESVLKEIDSDVDKYIKKTVEETKSKYGVTEEDAMKFLKGKVDEEGIESLSNIKKYIEKENEEIYDLLSERDIKRYNNDGKYYDEDFRLVIQKMVELGIKDKKVARLFVGDKGGTAHGESYSMWDVEKIELIIKEFDYAFEWAKEFVFQKEPKKRTVKRAVNVRSERPDLELEEIYRCLESGFTVRKIKNGEVERRDEEERESEEDAHEREREEGVESSDDVEASEGGNEDHDTSPVSDLASGERVSRGEQGDEAQRTGDQRFEGESKNSSVSTPLFTVLILVVLTVFLFALLA